jgi:hypothetical protein
MFVPMVHVRQMWVTVLQALVPVGVGVRLARRIVRRMLVLVMLVVDMGVHMLHRLVNVVMLVVLCEVQTISRTWPSASFGAGGGSAKTRSAISSIWPTNPDRRCRMWLSATTWL